VVSQTEETIGQPEASEPTPLELAHGTVKYYSAWSFGAGALPLPFVDTVLVIGVQVQMLRKLSDIYGAKFSEHVARNVVAALLGGLLSETVAFGFAAPLVRAVPLIGPLLGAFALPAVAASATYAVGQVFIRHFESGGTLLTFKPDKVRDNLRQAYDSAKAGLSGLKPKPAAT
jgi:uncharacterized protein (DUF697 family)